MKDLNEYLSKFAVAINCIGGDLSAIYQTSYEACEDKFNDNIMYIEYRYAPQLLLGGVLSSIEVVKEVQKAFAQATVDLNHRRKNEESKKHLPEFKVKQILCGIWNFPGGSTTDWLKENVEIAEKLDPNHEFIVGVDLAGGYGDNWKTSEEAKGYELAFKRAKNFGLGVTVHAGECVGADSIEWAVKKCSSDRIGHGYRLREDKELSDKYFPKKSVDTRHFEFCPRSSVLTNAQESFENHALNALNPVTDNLSLSTDDPGVQQNQLSEEYQIAADHFNWNMEEFSAANLNALNHAFSKCVDEKYINSFKSCYNKVAL